MARLKTGLAIITVTALGGSSLWLMQSHGGVAHSTWSSWTDLNQHFAELKSLDEQSRRLRLENENLRRWGEELQFRCASDAAKKSSAENAKHLKAETGSDVARVLAGIQYQPPSHLLPKQLYVLGVAYFDQGDFEKAAVIFSYLTGLSRYPEFKTPRVHLLAAAAWYRLEYYPLAEDYLKKVLSAPEEERRAEDLSQARLWLALVAKRNGSRAQVQQQLKSLIEHHPFSKEAKWVNPNGRAPSSGKGD